MNRAELYLDGAQSDAPCSSINFLDLCDMRSAVNPASRNVIKVASSDKDVLTQQEIDNAQAAKMAAAQEKWRDQPAEVQKYYMERVTEKLNPWKMTDEEKKETYSKLLEQADSYLAKSDQEFLASWGKLKKIYDPIAPGIERFRQDVARIATDIKERIQDIPQEDRQRLTDMLSVNSMLSDIKEELSSDFISELRKFRMDNGARKLQGLYDDTLMMRGTYGRVKDALISQGEFIGSARSTVGYIHHLAGDKPTSEVLEKERQMIRNSFTASEMQEALAADQPYVTTETPNGYEKVYLWKKP